MAFGKCYMSVDVECVATGIRHDARGVLCGCCKDFWLLLGLSE